MPAHTDSVTNSICRICGAKHVNTISARDHRFDLGNEFHYGECGGCGALELLNPPADPALHYPDAYYAFTPVRRDSLTATIRGVRNRLVLTGSGPIAAGARWLKPHVANPWLARTRLTRTARVLDVGCGAGELLSDLAGAGFQSLTGVDRFIPASIERQGFRVVRGTVADIAGEFDLVVFNHSLEHMRDGAAALAKTAALLATDGWCLVRLPVVPNEAWESYRERWVQLDAPRHEVIHSVDSLRRLSAEAGLEIEAVEYDSTAFQFVGSELYRRSLPLEANHTFTRRELARFEARAIALNAAGRGDQACFYLRRR
jgi:SAM-dependent methyltransferase